jgi:hypothetical protein
LIKTGKKAVAIRLAVLAYGDTWEQGKKRIEEIRQNWLKTPTGSE